MQQWRVFFLCSTGILTRLKVGEYKNTISSLYSAFYRIFLPTERVTSLPRFTYRQSSTERRMTSLRELPGVFLSTARARWLVARNNSEDQLLKEKACMIDRVKRKEERAFQREKIEVIECQRRTNQTHTPPRYSRFDLDKKCKCKDLQE